MDYLFDAVLPSTSSALPNSTGAQKTILPKGDASHSSTRTEEPSRSIDQIRNKVEELVERINTIRASDKEMDIYQKKLSEKLSEMCQQLKNHLYSLYEDNSCKIQKRLAELLEILNNCERLNQELLEATQALSHLKDTF